MLTFCLIRYLNSIWHFSSRSITVGTPPLSPLSSSFILTPIFLLYIIFFSVFLPAATFLSIPRHTPFFPQNIFLSLPPFFSATFSASLLTFLLSLSLNSIHFAFLPWNTHGTYPQSKQVTYIVVYSLSFSLSHSELLVHIIQRGYLSLSLLECGC